MDFVSGINNTMTKDGQNSATANLNIGGFKLTNGATATLVGDFPIVSDIQNSVHTFVTSTGSADAYVLTLAPAPAAYVAGQTFRFKANFASTGAVTLNVNALGAKAINRYGSIALVTGEIRVDQIVEVTYDGTQFQATSINDVPVPVASKFGAIVVQNTADDGYELLSGQGTSGQILTSNGADALPSFQAPTAGWTVVQSQTASSSAELSFNLGSSLVHVLVFADVIPASDIIDFQLFMSTDSGSTDVSTLDYHSSTTSMAATSYAAVAETGVSSMRIGTNVGSAAGEGLSGTLFVYDAASTDFTRVAGNMVWDDGAGNGEGGQILGRNNAAEAINNITLKYITGNIESGTVTLYSLGVT